MDPPIIFRGESSSSSILIAPEKAKSHKKKIRTEVVPMQKKGKGGGKVVFRTSDGRVVESILSKVHNPPLSFLTTSLNAPQIMLLHPCLSCIGCLKQTSCTLCTLCLKNQRCVSRYCRNVRDLNGEGRDTSKEFLFDNEGWNVQMKLARKILASKAREGLNSYNAQVDRYGTKLKLNLNRYEGSDFKNDAVKVQLEGKRITLKVNSQLSLLWSDGQRYTARIHDRTANRIRVKYDYDGTLSEFLDPMDGQVGMWDLRIEGREEGRRFEEGGGGREGVGAVLESFGQIAHSPNFSTPNIIIPLHFSTSINYAYPTSPDNLDPLKQYEPRFNSPQPPQPTRYFEVQYVSKVELGPDPAGRSLEIALVTDNMGGGEIGSKRQGGRRAKPKPIVGRPIYTVGLRTSSGEVVQLSSSDSPTIAWISALTQTPSLLSNATAKLRRCVAVVYRMCAIPECVPFLEMVDKRDLRDYEHLIRHELSFRKIRDNLANFVYEDQYQFASDVRLLFYNSQMYNDAETEIYHQSVELLRIFERFFLDWVVNPPNEVASGPWDEWYTMRYFDVVDDTHLTGFCASCEKNKFKNGEEVFTVCTICEDNHCRECSVSQTGIMGVSFEPKHRGERVCKRCRPVALHKFKAFVPPVKVTKAMKRKVSADKKAQKTTATTNGASKPPPKKRKVESAPVASASASTSSSSGVAAPTTTTMPTTTPAAPNNRNPNEPPPVVNGNGYGNGNGNGLNGNHAGGFLPTSTPTPNLSISPNPPPVPMDVATTTPPKSAKKGRGKPKGPARAKPKLEDAVWDVMAFGNEEDSFLFRENSKTLKFSSGWAKDTNNEKGSKSGLWRSPMGVICDTHLEVAKANTLEMTWYKSLFPEKPKKSMGDAWYIAKIKEVEDEERVKYGPPGEGGVVDKDKLKHRWNIDLVLAALDEKRGSQKGAAKYGDEYPSPLVRRASIEKVGADARHSIEVMPELTAEMIPEFGGGFGLFGLQDAKIQLMLEGLPFAEEILPMEYNFYEANCLLQNAEMQEVNKTQLSDADNISSTHLKRRLYEEISAWGFAKAESANDILTSTPTTGPNCQLQSPFPAIPNSCWDSLLGSWEYFNQFQDFLKFSPVSLEQFCLAVSSNDESGGDLVLTAGDGLVYDEMCCTLSRVLYIELKYLMEFQKVADCVDFYSQKVLNIHTWPEIAAQGICSLLPLKRHKGPDQKKFNPGQVKSEVNRAASFYYPGDGMASCVDILIVLGNHPLLEQFMHLEIDPDLAMPINGDKRVKPRDFSTIKRKISGSTYKHHSEFAADVRLTFATPLTYELPTTPAHQAAVHLFVYFERLYSKWILEEPDWKTKKINVYDNIDTINWRRRKKKGGGEMTSLASAKDFAMNGISMDGLGLGFPLGWQGRVSQRTYATNHIDRFFMSPDGRVYRSFVSISYDFPAIIVDREMFKEWEKQFLMGGKNYKAREVQQYVGVEFEEVEPEETKIKSDLTNDMPQDPTLTHPSWFVDKAASSYIKEDDSEGLSKNANPETVSLAMFGYRIRADVTKDIQMGDIHEFEEVLFLLRKRDPERWSVKERLKVISYLADFVMETNQFEAFVRPRDDDDVVDGEEDPGPGKFEVDKEDAEAGAEVIAALVFGEIQNQQQSPSEQKFLQWKASVKILPCSDMMSDSSEKFSCHFCKSTRESGPAVKNQDKDSWVMCPQVMTGVVPSSLDAFTGEVKEEPTEGTVRGEREIERIKEVQSAEPIHVHESCLRSVWFGRDVSHSKMLKEEKALRQNKTLKDDRQYTTSALGKDGSGAEYFALKDRIFRREPESWTLVVSLPELVKSLDSKNMFERNLKRSIMLRVGGVGRGVESVGGEKVGEEELGPLDLEMLAKRKLLTTIPKVRPADDEAAQELQFALSQVKTSLRCLEYYSLYVKKYEETRNVAGEEAGRFWQEYQTDFMEYFNTPVEKANAIGWMRPCWGQTVRELRGESVAKRVLMSDAWYKRRSQPFPQKDRELSANFPKIEPWEETLSVNGVFWKDYSGGYAGEKYAIQPVLRLDEKGEEMLAIYPNLTVAARAVDCEEELRLGEGGRKERGVQRWQASVRGLGTREKIAACCLNYMEGPVLGSSFLLAPYQCTPEGQRIPGMVVDHKSKPVAVPSEVDVMQKYANVLVDPNFVNIAEEPQKLPSIRRAVNSMTVNVPPVKPFTVSNSVLNIRLMRLKAAIFNIYSCIPKGEDYCGQSITGLKNDLGLSLDLEAWECALVLAQNPKEIDLLLTNLIKALPGSFVSERFKITMFCSGVASTCGSIAAKAYALDRMIGVNFQGAGAWNPKGRSSRAKKELSVICNENTLAGYLSLPVGRVEGWIAGGGGEGLRCCRDFTCGRVMGEHDVCGGRVGGLKLPEID